MNLNEQSFAVAFSQNNHVHFSGQSVQNRPPAVIAQGHPLTAKWKKLFAYNKRNNLSLNIDFNLSVFQ
jgi:hypothetical protein